jgi:hypothetical protein
LRGPTFDPSQAAVVADMGLLAHIAHGKADVDIFEHYFHVERRSRSDSKLLSSKYG